MAWKKEKEHAYVPSCRYFSYFMQLCLPYSLSKLYHEVVCCISIYSINQVSSESA